jgi:hypothetical protein
MALAVIVAFLIRKQADLRSSFNILYATLLQLFRSKVRLFKPSRYKPARNPILNNIFLFKNVAGYVFA